MHNHSVTGDPMHTVLDGYYRFDQSEFRITGNTSMLFRVTKHEFTGFLASVYSLYDLMKIFTGGHVVGLGVTLVSLAFIQHILLREIFIGCTINR
jgi:hypothetical protein